MLGFFTRLGKHLYRIRHVLWLALFTSIAGFCVLLIMKNNHHTDSLLTLSMLTALWSLCALGIQMTFTDTAPEIESSDGFFTCVKKKFSLAARWLLAIVATGVTVAVLVISFRVLNALS